MPKNDVRRMLADNMRCFDVVSDVSGRCWLNGTLFGMDISARNEERIRCGMNHLADLIEPKPVESGGFDREALLALAEEMVEMFRIGASTGEGIDRSWCRELHDKYARRIREALGATPDGR